MIFMFYGLIFFAVSIWLEKIWIEWLNAKSVKQIQKEYGPRVAMESKGKVPAMGGIVFMAMALPCIMVGWALGEGTLLFQLKIWSLPLGAGVIGLADDLLKVFHRSSEGLSSLRKLFFQILVALLWSIWISFPHGVDLLPGMMLSRMWSVPLLTFLTVSMLNAVNVTDGLDGLAGGASVISLLVLALFSEKILFPVASGGAVLLAFLWYNAYPAKVFMGDVGSHFLGGLLVSLSVCGGGALYVVPAGALFGLEILSVLIQIISIRAFNKKIFRMSPVHHHFELSGWSEVQIVTRFWLVHITGITLLSLGGVWLIGKI